MADIVTDLTGYFKSLPPNETTLVSEIDDPPKHRMGVKRQEGWGRSLGAHSFNSVRSTDVEDEVVLLQGKIDDRFPLDQLAGEYRWDIKKPGDSSDAGMIGVMNAFHDKIQFNVPISAPNLTGGTPTFMSSPNGRYRANLQDDGNLVVYDTDPDQNPSTPWWSAVWSWLTGEL